MDKTQFVILEDFNSQDVAGELYIATGKYSKNIFDTIIADTEEKILTDLLGADLYLKLVTDLDTNGQPQTQIFKDFVNGAVYTYKYNNIDYNVNYKGVKTMLMYFIYFEIQRQNQYTVTNTGFQKADSENSNLMGTSEVNHILSRFYNKGVKLYGDSFVTNAYLNKGVELTNDGFQVIFQPEMSRNMLKGTCFNFLFVNMEQLPTWQFTRKEILTYGTGL